MSNFEANEQITANQFIDEIDQLVSSKLFSNVIDLAKKALSLYPENPILHAAIAYAYIEKNCLKIAKKHINIALQYDPLCTFRSIRQPIPVVFANRFHFYSPMHSGVFAKHYSIILF